MIPFDSLYVICYFSKIGKSRLILWFIKKKKNVTESTECWRVTSGLTRLKITFCDWADLFRYEFKNGFLMKGDLIVFFYKLFKVDRHIILHPLGLYCLTICIDSLPDHHDFFLTLRKKPFEKNCGKKEKMLVTTIFSLFPQYFLPYQRQKSPL